MRLSRFQVDLGWAVDLSALAWAESVTAVDFRPGGGGAVLRCPRSGERGYIGLLPVIRDSTERDRLYILVGNLIPPPSLMQSYIHTSEKR